LENKDYQQLFKVVEKIGYKNRYIHSIRNSHDIVNYLMIFMNYHSAKDFIHFQNGIFRSTILNRSVVIPEHLPSDVGDFMKIWNSNSGQYIDLKEGKDITHDFLKIDAYVHITSPIRRIVDLLNLIQFQENHHMISLSDGAREFYDQWLQELEYINTTMRAIRSLQTDCYMLKRCYDNPEILDKIYDGYTFDKIVRHDDLYQFIVYLPELKLISKITTRENIDNFQAYKFQPYLFHNEEKMKKKIRLQIISESVTKIQKDYTVEDLNPHSG